MQILELVLYGNNGDKRSLPFRPGKVNIITGKSKSGKSAVGDIIEYCMGGKTCNIADGVVRENVAWYGLLLQCGVNHIFVARANPATGQQSTSFCYYEIGNESLTSPKRADFISNTNVEGIEGILTEAAGIKENIHIPDGDATRAPIAANIRHSLFYCFQSQDEIAARNVLFHRQSEPFIPQAIKDTLPYFLGAVSDNVLSLIEERKELSKQVSRLRRKLSEIENINDDGLGRAISLLTEAESVGLIPDTTGLANRDFYTIYNVLKNITLEDRVIPSEKLDKLSYLQTQLKIKEDELVNITNQIDDAKAGMRDASGFNIEANHQKTRLESIGLFDKLDFNAGKCPLCSGDLNPEPPSVAALKESIISLDRAISTVEKERPQLQRYIAQKEESASAIKRDISTIKAEIDGVYKQYDDEKQIEDLNKRRAKVYGRISYWLESTQIDNDPFELKTDLEADEEKLKNIDAQISNESVEERTISALSIISKDMTEWADQLDMEFAGSPYRLDINKVTVAVDRKRPIYLKEMGSASNWLGAHLITMFGLHKYFIEHKRPVPGFLFLDQPSQAYFPENSVKDEDMDIEAVSKVYGFIEQRVKAAKGNLQVIVVDHASLDENDFEQSTIEDWRSSDMNLVPVSWYQQLALAQKSEG